MKPKGHALKISALVAGLLALCAIAGWFLWAASANRRLEAKLEELAAGGYATKLAQLAPAMPPDDENGAALFDAAFAGWPDPLPAELGALIERTSPEFTDEELATLDAFLDEHADVFAMFEEAAARPRCVFPRDYTQGYGILLPQIAQVIKTVKLMRMRAWRQAAAGDFAGAARTVETMVATAECVREEPILVSQLVRIVALGIALDTLQPLAEDMPADALARVRDRLDPDGVIAGMRRAYRGEMAFAASLVGEDATGTLGVEMPALLDTILTRPLLKEDFVMLLEFEQRMVDAAELPYPQAQPAMVALDADAQAVASDWRHPFTAMLIPAVGRSLPNAAKLQTRLVLARAVIDLMLTGELRDPPIDPMTGDPIQYDAEAGVLSSGGGETWTLRGP